MPKLTEEEVKAKEDAEVYLNSFATMFSIDDLRVIYDEEKEQCYNFDILSKGLMKKDDCRDSDFINIIPRTMKYIKEHIFHGENGDYYAMSYNEEAGFFPKQMDKKLITDLFFSKFPPLVKKWWNCDSTYYHIGIDTTKGRIYKKGNIHYLNIFNGFPDDHYKRCPDIIKKHKDNVTFFWSHIKENLCSNNEAIFQEVKNWLCALIGGRRKMKTAPYFKGVMGSGRGVLIELISKILGANNCCRIQHPDQVLGQFNGHLAGKLFVYFDDVKMSYEQFTNLYDTLKVPITEDKNFYRDLFKTGLTLQNINSWFLVANHDILKLEAGAGKCRRIIPADVSPVMRTPDYYERLHNLKDNVEFRRAFLWYCQDNYNPSYNEQISIKSLPLTTSGIDAVQHSITPFIAFLKHRILTVPDVSFNQHTEPKKFYEEYCQFYNDSEKGYDKKRILQKHFFLQELRKTSFMTIKECRHNGSNRTNYVVGDKQNGMAVYKQRGYITEDDLIEHNIKDGNKSEEEVLEDMETYLRYLQEDVKAQEELIKKQKEKMAEKKEEVEEKPAPIIVQTKPIEPIVTEEETKVEVKEEITEEIKKKREALKAEARKRKMEREARKKRQEHRDVVEEVDSLFEMEL